MLVATPQQSHADSFVGACAPEADGVVDADQVVSALQFQLQGGTSNALPSSAVPGSTPTTAVSDYGFISWASGLSPAFQPAQGKNERNSLFTFSSTATSAEVLGGFFPASTHTGTMTIYASTGEAGDFSNPASFHSGTPILSASFTTTNTGSIPLSIYGRYFPAGSFVQPALTSYYTQTGIGQSFSSAGTGTVTSTPLFSLGGTCYQLGVVGQSLKWTATGHLASPTSLNGAFTGVLASAGL